MRGFLAFQPHYQARGAMSGIGRPGKGGYFKERAAGAGRVRADRFASDLAGADGPLDGISHSCLNPMVRTILNFA
jgi:hypothetical protein